VVIMNMIRARNKFKRIRRRPAGWLGRRIGAVAACAAVTVTTLKMSAEIAASRAIFGTSADAERIIGFEIKSEAPDAGQLASVLLGSGNEDIPGYNKGGEIEDEPADAAGNPSTQSPAAEDGTDDNTDNNIENGRDGSAVDPSPALPDAPLYFKYSPSIDQDDSGAGIDNNAPISDNGIIIVNAAGADYDIESILESPLSIDLSGDEPKVLIIHTHSSEAYTPTEQYPYEESDPYRNEDPTRNIITVGSEIAKKLSEAGISVIHDTGVYDYPSYNGSYGRTLVKIREYLETYPSIECVLDVHRDAIGENSDGKERKTSAIVNGVSMSQIYFFVGTDTELDHPNWRQNLTFAVRLTAEMNRLYPTLSRGMYLSKYRYNQHLCRNYVIVEVGAAGNTLEESLLAADYFAECLANLGLSVKNEEADNSEYSESLIDSEDQQTAVTLGNTY